MMKSTFRKLALGALALAMSAGMVAAQGPEPVKFSLDWVFQGHHAIWGLALKNKHFEKNNLNVSMVRGYGSLDTVTKIASGAYDIGFVDINSLIKFNAEHPDRALLAFYQVFDRTPNAIIALKKSGIAKPSDLAGKTIGAPEGDPARMMFGAFAKANKLDPASVKWITVDPSRRETMLLEGKVDAISGFSSTSVPDLTYNELPEEDVVLLSYADNHLDLYGSVLAAKPDYIAAHPDVIKGFIKATMAGTIDLLMKPNAGMIAMWEMEPAFNGRLEASRVRFMMKHSILMSADVVNNGLGYVDPKRMEQTIRTDSEANNIPAPAADKIYTTQYLPPAAERMLPH